LSPVPALSDAIVANPRPAATVVVLRDSSSGPEVFMVRRHEGTAFMGGAHVFPGGRVDAADYGADEAWCDGIPEAVQQLDGLPRVDALAYHVAASRELFEEAGVLLARDAEGAFVSLAGAADRDRFRQDRRDVHGGRTPLRSVIEREHLHLGLDALVLFAHWVTPPIDTRQFDTRFFMTRVPPHQVPAHDDTETTHSMWMTPAVAIAQSLNREIILPPPTWATLRELEPFASVEDALAWARQRRVMRRMPLVFDHDGRRTLVIPGDPLHPDADAGPLSETRFVLDEGRWRAERART
jgi:8-oxo-dGTP pyrophosphatase MutT (NUDIX family)